MRQPFHAERDRSRRSPLRCPIRKRWWHQGIWTSSAPLILHHRIPGQLSQSELGCPTGAHGKTLVSQHVLIFCLPCAHALLPPTFCSMPERRGRICFSLKLRSKRSPASRRFPASKPMLRGAAQEALCRNFASTRPIHAEGRSPVPTLPLKTSASISKRFFLHELSPLALRANSQRKLLEERKFLCKRPLRKSSEQVLCASFSAQVLRESSPLSNFSRLLAQALSACAAAGEGAGEGGRQRRLELTQRSWKEKIAAP